MIFHPIPSSESALFLQMRHASSTTVEKWSNRKSRSRTAPRALVHAWSLLLSVAVLRVVLFPVTGQTTLTTDIKLDALHGLVSLNGHFDSLVVTVIWTNLSGLSTSSFAASCHRDSHCDCGESEHHLLCLVHYFLL